MVNARFNNTYTDVLLLAVFVTISFLYTGRGNGLAAEPTSRNPEGRGSIPRLDSRRSSLTSIEHAELLRSTNSLVLCYSNHGIASALRLGPTQPVTDFLE